MPRKGNGVEIRETSIRISFVDHTGTQRRETLKTNGIPLAPTPANVKYANRQGDQILPCGEKRIVNRLASSFSFC